MKEMNISKLNYQPEMEFRDVDNNNAKPSLCVKHACKQPDHTSLPQNTRKEMTMAVEKVLLHAAILALNLAIGLAYTPSNTVPPPPISRATQLPNEIYTWRNQQVRYD